MAELTATTAWNRRALYKPFDWVNDEIRVILMRPSATWANSITNDFSYSNFQNSEVAGFGYQAGGKPLENKSISLLGYHVRYRCDPLSWLEFTGEARWAVFLHWVSEQNNEKWMMAHVDFGQIAYGNLSPIVIRWNSNIALQSRVVLEET